MYRLTDPNVLAAAAFFVGSNGQTARAGTNNDNARPARLEIRVRKILYFSTTLEYFLVFLYTTV